MISISPLARSDLDRVSHLELAEGQDRFVNPVAKMTTGISARVDFHMIENDGAAVGVFKIGHDYSQKHGFAQDGEAGLMGFLVGHQYQGQGFAKAALAIMAKYLAATYPKMNSVLLTVNCDNPAAHHVYQRGGFVELPELYFGGTTGPQYAMRLGLTGKAA
ncbi:MAG: GNAT family N-acetyltransferase [Marinosulfonomonas sp.]|nr:GNAT family N-acetyltransferase [Marinosulfonomonas sp.]